MAYLLDSSGLPILDSAGLPLFDSAGDPAAIAFSNTVLAQASVAGQDTSPSFFASRLRAVLPVGWFADVSPVLDALLQGCGAVWGAIYDQVLFVRKQTRITTATGVHLDMAALDYLGGSLVRKPGQGDAAFSLRIRREIVRERVTRSGLIQALTDLTGRAPKVFEPARATDTGGYGRLGMTAGTGLAYAGAGAPGTGGYGSLALPFQVFVTAYRATGGGIANVAGYYTGSGWAGGGYGVGAIQYAQLSMSQGQITDADIDAQIAAVMPAAGVAWTAITN